MLGAPANPRTGTAVRTGVASSTYLLETMRLAVGEFRCPPDDPAWHETNDIGDEPHIVFPLTPVLIDQVDKGRVLTTANHTIFYDANQLYRRRLESANGDHCIFVRLGPKVFERLAAHALDDDKRLRAIHAPSDREAYLERHLLVRQLRAGAVDRLAAEERALGLVRAALSRTRRARPARSDRTRAAHRELAEAAKAMIARSFPEPLPLDRIASAVRASAFHLARVFRAETGFTIGAYQRSLRLRAALERLPTHADGLTMLALELGFSSHSHFTETFRREFGVTPSSLR